MFQIFVVFFGAVAPLGPDLGPLRLRNLILVASSVHLGGPPTPQTLEKSQFSLGFLRFFAYSHFRYYSLLGTILDPFWLPFGPF